MNIRCRNCTSQFNLPDHKMPEDKDTVFKCPRCREKIQGPAVTVGTPPDAGMEGARPVTFFQEQALVIVPDGPFLKPVTTAVRKLGYTMDTAAEPIKALKKMAYHVYQLVVLEDRYDQGQGIVLTHMNILDMSLRRMTCLVLLSRQVKTGNPMAAIHASVNFVAGPDALQQLSAILSVARVEHRDFYRVYMDAMKAAGKA